MDLVSLQFVEVFVSDVHTGETLKHFTLAPGDVAMTDRGYAHAQGMSDAVKRGAALIVRLNPLSVVLGDALGQSLSLRAALQRQKIATIRTLEVVLQSSDGQDEAGLGACLSLERGTSRACPAQGRQRREATPKVETLYRAGWVLVFTTLPPAVLSAQTIMALYRCRWYGNRDKTLEEVFDVDALRAKATSPLAEVWLHGKLLYALMLERRMRRQLGDRGGRLDHERVGTWWRVWGMLKDERWPRLITGALFWQEDAWAACALQACWRNGRAGRNYNSCLSRGNRPALLL